MLGMFEPWPSVNHNRPGVAGNRKQGVPTDPFTALEFQNPSNDVPELDKIS